MLDNRLIIIRMWDKTAGKHFYKTESVLRCLTQQITGLFDHEGNGSVFEQFTGLYDNTTWEELSESERSEWTMDGNVPSEWTGHEVFEGDLVRMHQFLFDGDEVECETEGVVQYNESCAAFGLSITKLQHGHGHDLSIGDWIPFTNFYGLHEESFLVIGNVHEGIK